MKRIKLYCYISAILCAALLLSSCVSDNAPEDEAPASSAGTEVSASDESETASEETSSPDGESSSPWDKWITDESELNEEQRQQLEALREEGERKAGRFWYQEMVIFGRVDPAQPKLELETAKKIIAENTDFETILKEFEKIQPYPDFAGGSGVTNIEYWGGAGMNVQIAIIYEQSQIYGETYNEDGTLLGTELIFG